jgi:mannose-6-phosphate isomerase-like protein (cupin superfamily)
MENTTKMQKKSMNSPDETRTFDKGKIEITKIGDTSIGKMYLEPGWSWEKCLKPIAKTESCQASHTQYVVSGRVRVKMNDESEEEYGPGDVLYIPPGHNTWVVGNEPYVGIEFATMENYAKKEILP